MTAMKFVGVIFDPEKFKSGEAEINDALSDGFEVIRDFETAGGIVMALGKWERKDFKFTRTQKAVFCYHFCKQGQDKVIYREKHHKS